MVTHGHAFERSMDRHRWFLTAFQFMHSLRQRLGAQPIHVAQLAKKLKPLYGYLCREQRINAVRFAREQGYPAIACGHVHLSEDSIVDGIRYLNTGCWTEPDTQCLVCLPDRLLLTPVETLLADWEQ